jgi:hypothetical protein
MTAVDRYGLRRVLWSSQGWRDPLDLDKAAAAAAEELVATVTMSLMQRSGEVPDLSAVEERIRARFRVILDQAVARLEADGVPVDGIDGSMDRALAALMTTIGSLEGTEGATP